VMDSAVAPPTSVPAYAVTKSTKSPSGRHIPDSSQDLPHNQYEAGQRNETPVGGWETDRIKPHMLHEPFFCAASPHEQNGARDHVRFEAPFPRTRGLVDESPQRPESLPNAQGSLCQ
jgi:hypothetical protein